MNTRKLSITKLVTVAAVLLVSATMLVPVGAANIGVTGFQTPPMSDFVPSISVNGFQTPLMSDFVPSIAVTGFRTPLMSDIVPSIAVTGFRTPPMSDFVPSISVTGFATGLEKSLPAPLSEIFALFPPSIKVIGQASVYAPLSEIFALFPAPVKVPAIVVARQYQYGPAALATGFASPAESGSNGR